MNMWWVACMHTPCWRSHRWFGNSAAWMLMFLTVASLSFIAWMCTPACRSHLCLFWPEWLDSMQHWAVTPGRIFFSRTAAGFIFRFVVHICWRGNAEVTQHWVSAALSCCIRCLWPHYTDPSTKQLLSVCFFRPPAKMSRILAAEQKAVHGAAAPGSTVFFFRTVATVLGAALIFMPAWRRHMCFFDQSDWT